MPFRFARAPLWSPDIHPEGACTDPPRVGRACVVKRRVTAVFPSCAAREPRAAWLFFAVSSEDFDPSLSTAHWTLVIAPFPLSSARVWP